MHEPLTLLTHSHKIKLYPYKMLRIGSKIKKLRELKNYTQEYMANSLKMSVTGYGKIERDDTDLSIGRLEEIGKILEIDPSNILSFDEKQIFNINNNQNSFVNTQQIVQDEGFRMLITQLQEEIKHLRQENSRLLSLFERINDKK
jgi:transcriptional regulator with XRE-family HTH domain